MTDRLVLVEEKVAVSLGVGTVIEITSYKRFNEFRPRYFDETTNPWDADKWVEHMEGIFEVMGCLDRQKAVLAAFQLEGEAKEWSKAGKKTFEGPENEIA